MLVKLDDTLQQAQLQQAQAQASIARTNLQRSRELVAQNFVSQSAVDQNAAALEVAEAQVSLMRAQLARMTIVAPFEGVAGIRNVDVGDYVKDGADVVQIEDLSSVWVDFRLPERFSASVKTAQVVDVSFDALPGRRFAGRVEALDSLIDADGRSLLVRARIDNSGGELKSGMFARTRIVFGTRANALVVPEEALVPQGGRQFVVKLVEGPNRTGLAAPGSEDRRAAAGQGGGARGPGRRRHGGHGRAVEPDARRRPGREGGRDRSGRAARRRPSPTRSGVGRLSRLRCASPRPPSAGRSSPRSCRC